MSLKIALTGATGFVGRALIPKLLEKGHLVSALVRSPETANLPSSIKMVRGDLHDASALRQFTAASDVVLHVAGAIAGISRKDFLRANLEGTQHVAEAAIANRVKRFVYVSSLAAREPRIGPYGESKMLAEQMLLAFGSALNLKILRPSAVYGPGDKATLPLLKALLAHTAVIPGSKDARFSMIHVDDVAVELLRASETEDTGVFELDDGEGGHDWAELIGIVRENFGTAKRVVFIPRGVATTLGTMGDGLAMILRKPMMISAKQMRQLYHPDWVVSAGQQNKRIGLAEGLPSTIHWYQAKGLLPHRSAEKTTTQGET
jgi:nucleoside-diphosphate-sugar epimerase